MGFRPPSLHVKSCSDNNIVCAVDEKRIVAVIRSERGVRHCSHATLTVLQRRSAACDRSLTWLQSYLSDSGCTLKFLVDGAMSLQCWCQCQLQRPSRLSVGACRVYYLHWKSHHSLLKARSRTPPVWRQRDTAWRLYNSYSMLLYRRPWIPVFRCACACTRHRSSTIYTWRLIADVRSWCSSRRLHRNTDKTELWMNELIWFDSR